MEHTADLPEPLVIDLPDPEATRALGRSLGLCLAPGVVVALLGELGAGKTALVKAAVAALGEVEEDDVVSPTFLIAVEYGGRVPTIHIDAYRLSGPGALEDLAFDLHGAERAALIEWADRVAEALPRDRLTIELEHSAPGRRATVRAGGPRSARILSSLSGQ